MGIFDTASAGVKTYRTRKNKSYRKLMDIDFGRLYPAFSRFVLPGDVWKLGANMLLRYQPMAAPPLTRSWARMRYFFVPLRLIEEHTEEIITGSKNGKLITGELPTFAKMFDGIVGDQHYEVKKWSILDYFGIPCGNYKYIKSQKIIPAAYWYKAYLRCWFDYYRDENIDTYADDFDTYIVDRLKYIGYLVPESVKLKKDYFTSSLPFQLKGVAPAIDISLTGSADFTNAVGIGSSNIGINLDYSQNLLNASAHNASLILALNKNTVNVSDATINADELRTMMAQTRIFERLARCGSKYTEYLRANFGTSPSDGTLQRAQYLGGFKQPIVTTEVVQTGADSDDEFAVGTLRGHGISNGGNTIAPFVAKEFGVILGLLDVMPEIQYTQGIDKEYTYTERFDFFNRSFQHLSEQEVRNGELFVEFSASNTNDETFGYQPYATELMTSRDVVVGDLRDTLSYWTQAIHFNSRPHLNYSFITASSYANNFKQPFNVTDGAMPIIADIYNFGDVYRCMDADSDPGYLDHN